VGKVEACGWVVLWRGTPVRWFKREAWAVKYQQKLGPEARRAEVWYSTGLTE